MLSRAITGAQANDEKMRLEEKQRQERAATQAASQPWQANWFEQVRCCPSCQFSRLKS